MQPQNKSTHPGSRQLKDKLMDCLPSNPNQFLPWFFTVIIGGLAVPFACYAIFKGDTDLMKVILETLAGCLAGCLGGYGVGALIQRSKGQPPRDPQTPTRESPDTYDG